MAKLALTLACGDYDRTLALRTGAVRPEDLQIKDAPDRRLTTKGSRYDAPVFVQPQRE